MAETTNSTIEEGGCLCGAVRFTLSGDLRAVVYCHCEQCRRTSGHFVAATRIDDSAFTLTESAGLRWYDSSEMAKRGFCQQCGSSLFWKRNGGEHTSIMAGAMDDKNRLVADRHIFLADKAAYYTVDDGLLCFDEAD